MKIRSSDVWKIGVVLLVFGVGLAVSYQILKPKKQLPIYNPAQLDERLVDESIQRQGRNHRALPFALLNQYGDTVTEDSLDGKIYVADFFFTTCPGICKDMAAQKRRLQKETMEMEDFAIVSHSVTPEMDSVPTLKKYAELHGAKRGKWQLLTGDKPQIYKLARQSYFAVLDSGGTGDENDFIHTENFVLIDKEKRIRGFYDGTSENDVDKLLQDLAVLEKEKPAE